MGDSNTISQAIATVEAGSQSAWLIHLLMRYSDWNDERWQKRIDKQERQLHRFMNAWDKSTCGQRYGAMSWERAVDPNFFNNLKNQTTLRFEPNIPALTGMAVGAGMAASIIISRGRTLPMALRFFGVGITVGGAALLEGQSTFGANMADDPL